MSLPMPTDKKFTGQRFDGTGLYYYNARYYDPTIGRFISPDTVIQSFANPQCFNRYSYCLNNPLKYIDPSGNKSVDTMILGMMVVSGCNPLAIIDEANKIDGEKDQGLDYTLPGTRQDFQNESYHVTIFDTFKKNKIIGVTDGIVGYEITIPSDTFNLLIYLGYSLEGIIESTILACGVVDQGSTTGVDYRYVALALAPFAFVGRSSEQQTCINWYKQYGRRKSI
jgi:RHS repeat-associated protein